MSAAVAYPIPHDRRVATRPDGRPDLRVLPGGRTGRRPSHRVYLRRRLLAAVLAAALLWCAGWFLGSLGGGPLAAPGPVQSVAGHTYVVQPGDTLWSIARRVHPDGDVRPVVQQLAAANGGASITPGQHLVLP